MYKDSSDSNSVVYTTFGGSIGQVEVTNAITLKACKDHCESTPASIINTHLHQQVASFVLLYIIRVEVFPKLVRLSSCM
jgi:hypothetical protein